MSHTPGPWEILRLDEICSVPVAIRGGNGRLVVGNEGGLAPEAYEWTVGEIKANAHLIAAAPDMLKMLLELQECAEYWAEYDVPLGIVGRLNETIKKARGEE